MLTEKTQQQQQLVSYSKTTVYILRSWRWRWEREGNGENEKEKKRLKEFPIAKFPGATVTAYLQLMVRFKSLGLTHADL